MTWLEKREEAFTEADNDARQVSLARATEIAIAFFQEEVLPRMHELLEVAKSAGLHSTLRVGAELPRGGGLLERAEVAVKRKVGETAIMAAELEVYCKGGFECQAVTGTKEGRTLSLVFTVAGEPIQHLDSVFREFALSIGIQS